MTTNTNANNSQKKEIKTIIPSSKLEDLYDITRLIGRGAFSAVYLAKHKKKNERVAIKVENEMNNSNEDITQNIAIGSLKHECKILLYLSKGITGIPRIRWFEIRENVSFLVMDYYKYNLSELVNTESSSLKLRKKDKIDIFKQAFQIIKSIHSNFIIHRDIKPANIMLQKKYIINHETESEPEYESESESETESETEDEESMNLQNKKSHGRYDVFIIDFGMAKVYVDDENEHMKERTITDIIGTPKFISLFVHDHIEPSRRDDFISLGYVFLYMFQALTWYNQPNERVPDLKRLHLADIISDLSRGTPKNNIFQFISEYLNDCYLLEFNETYNKEFTLS